MGLLRPWEDAAAVPGVCDGWRGLGREQGARSSPRGQLHVQSWGVEMVAEKGLNIYGFLHIIWTYMNYKFFIYVLVYSIVASGI